MVSSRPRRFLLAFVTTIVVGLTAVAALNVVIDPFWRFGLVTLHGVNDQRPLISSYVRSAKAGVVCRLRPAQIAIGTSRTEVGIDPKHPGWGSEPGPVYNLGLAGLGLKELSLTFRHAVNASQLKRATIGLDFMMFNANREASVFGTEVIDFDERQLVLSASDSCWRPMLENFNNLLGGPALLFSVRTIRGQLGAAEAQNAGLASAWVSLYDENGFRSHSPLGFNLSLGPHGSRYAFSDLQEKYYVSKVWRPPPDERYCFTRPGQPNTMDRFREMVRFARQSGVDVRFYLEPTHSRMMLALQDAGLWPQFEDWKRGIVEVLDEDAKESGKPEFPLWDFSGFNTITNEHVPDADDRDARMRWFWEPSHYKKETGDLILDRVLGYQAPDRSVPADFGIRLSPQNIDAWLSVTRRAGEDYVRAEPKEAQFIKDVVDRAMTGAAGSNCGSYMDQLQAGSEAVRRGDYDTAQWNFDRAKAIDESDRRRAAEIGVAYREAGFASALQTAEAGGEFPVNLSSWQKYQERGIQRDAAGDHRGGAEDFAHAIRIGPPNPALSFLSGVALLHAADPEAAATQFEAGLKLDPGNATLRDLLDQARSATGHPLVSSAGNAANGATAATPRN